MGFPAMPLTNVMPMPWYVLYTNPRAEKKVAEQLSWLGIEVYCPQVSRLKQWSDRKKIVVTPLFSSYVFVNVEEHKRDSVFVVKGVVRYLFWLGKPAVVKEKEIEAIKKWLSTDFTDIGIEAICEGDNIKIKEGLFKDYSGIVQKVSKTMVKLVLESTGVIITLKYKETAAV